MQLSCMSQKAGYYTIKLIIKHIDETQRETTLRPHMVLSDFCSIFGHIASDVCTTPTGTGVTDNKQNI